VIVKVKLPLLPPLDQYSVVPLNQTEWVIFSFELSTRFMPTIVTPTLTD